MSINVQPIGAPTDPIFTPQDLADIDREFVTSGAYFGNPQGTVICLPNGQCSVAAEANPWVTMPGLPLVHHSLVVPDPPVPSIPEPAYGVLVFVLLFLIVAILHRRPS